MPAPRPSACPVGKSKYNATKEPRGQHLPSAGADAAPSRAHGDHEANTNRMCNMTHRSLPAAFLLACLTLAPGAAAADLDAEAYVEQTLADLDRIALQLARQKEHAPEDRRDAIRAGYVYHINSHVSRLERSTDASQSQIDAFRDQAEAIGRDHGLVD